MDPNANLAEQRVLTSRMLDENHDLDVGDAARLAELVEALDEWITRGGCLPRSWEPKR